VSNVTAGVLLTAAGLHVAWGAGSSFPFRSTAELTENVVGSPHPPSRSACFSVAVLLGGIAAAVAVRPHLTVHRRLLQLTSAVLGLRAIAGFAGRTDVLVPGSTSALFRRRDRQIFAPLCALLSAGVWSSSRRSSPKTVSRDAEAGSSCRQRWVGGMRA
jgi:hypothetical protein